MKYLFFNISLYLFLNVKMYSIYKANYAKLNINHII